MTALLPLQRTPLSSPARSFITLIGDTAGGPDVGPFRLGFGGSEDDEIAFVVASCVVWVVFVVVMPILLINMLVSRPKESFKLSVKRLHYIYVTRVSHSVYHRVRITYQVSSMGTIDCS